MSSTLFEYRDSIAFTEGCAPRGVAGVMKLDSLPCMTCKMEGGLAGYGEALQVAIDLLID